MGKVPRGIPVGKMEWLFLAAGTGLYAMSKSKNMKQIDKFIADGKKAGGFQGMSKQLSSFLTSQDQAGGFKEKMDKAEASKILSVCLDEKEINQAFRQLMIANHPDKGGSRYISEKVNEAKDLMTGKSTSGVFDKN